MYAMLFYIIISHSLPFVVLFASFDNHQFIILYYILQFCELFIYSTLYYNLCYSYIQFRIIFVSSFFAILSICSIVYIILNSIFCYDMLSVYSILCSAIPVFYSILLYYSMLFYIYIFFILFYLFYSIILFPLLYAFLYF